MPAWIHELEAGPDGRPFREQLADFGDRVGAFFTELSPRMGCLRASGIPPNEVVAHYDVPPVIAAVQGMSVRFNEDSQRAYLAEFVDLYARALELGE